MTIIMIKEIKLMLGTVDIEIMCCTEFFFPVGYHQISMSVRFPTARRVRTVQVCLVNTAALAQRELKSRKVMTFVKERNLVVWIEVFSTYCFLGRSKVQFRGYLASNSGKGLLYGKLF